jgi:DNA primase
MISKATIDTVFETARVEEVIGDFVQLKRAGSNFKGLSPFSDERSPSLWFRPLKGFGKILVLKRGICCLCNGAHFTYPEAISLARKYNIEIEETEQTNEEKQIQIFERVCIWFLNLQKTIFIKHF